MKFSVNHMCPCGSNIKYKKCCQIYHKGKIPKTALALMKSRYVAYKLSNAKYIIKTTHKNNKDYSDEFNSWEKDILDFSKNCQFNNLEILEFIDKDEESFVSFKVDMICENKDNSFNEKSRFLKENGIWYYESGNINEQRL